MASTTHGQDHRLPATDAENAHHTIRDPALAVKIHLENPDIEPAAIALYEKHQYDCVPLAGPTDLHTSEHYMQLYILALRLSDERLQNTIMDLVRHFYACDRLSASPSRLEYIYHASSTTSSPNNMMKRFLVTSAAFRALAEASAEGRDAWGKEVYVSSQMNALLEKDKDVMADLVNAIVNLHRNDMPDVRGGGNCPWHVHEKTSVCAKEYAEAWQSA